MKTSLKRFVSIVMALLMVFTCTAIFAEGDVAEGDVYLAARDERYPDRHWIFMTADEISYYESLGWQRTTGVLWYDTTDENSAVSLFEVDDCQKLINEGLVFHIIYTWTCPGDRLGKYTEQSVSCGYWQLNAQQAQEYHSTYVLPELRVSDNEITGKLYESNWAYEGQFAEEPDDSMDPETLSKFTFVRLGYNEYFKGYGETKVLLNGEVQEFTLDQAVEIGGFDSEMPKWV